MVAFPAGTADGTYAHTEYVYWVPRLSAKFLEMNPFVCPVLISSLRQFVAPAGSDPGLLTVNKELLEPLHPVVADIAEYVSRFVLAPSAR